MKEIVLKLLYVDMLSVEFVRRKEHFDMKFKAAN